jgi:hypothetical protein
MLTYAAFIQKAKKLTNAGENLHVDKMLYLVEIHHQRLLWQRLWKKDWESILRAERLSTIGLFNNFKQATKYLSEEELRRFGVMASARIGSLSTKIREDVLRQVRSWWQEHRVPPEYQLVTEFVRLHSRIPKAKKHRIPILLAHIKKQNHILRTNGLHPLPLPLPV